MLVLGHVGIGGGIARAVRPALRVGWLALGCLLPDLIDKPLFYGLELVHGSTVAPILGSRSVGHTLWFILAVAAFALWRRTPAAWAVFAGVLTHLPLDVLGELFTGADPESSVWLAVFWPFLGPNFPRAHFHTVIEQLRVSAESVYVVAGEIVGALVIARWWLRERRRRRLNEAP